MVNLPFCAFAALALIDVASGLQSRAGASQQSSLSTSIASKALSNSKSIAHAHKAEILIQMTQTRHPRGKKARKLKALFKAKAKAQAKANAKAKGKAKGKAKTSRTAKMQAGGGMAKATTSLKQDTEAEELAKHNTDEKSHAPTTPHSSGQSSHGFAVNNFPFTGWFERSGISSWPWSVFLLR
eukprot:TRINITY_DN40740_c0_g1_i1.p1 TRINITY_DN40740_c0_g1~~TRINITY_DN40740_c0_g1_i1.p1  ORF type:complete len:183 (-),score=27.88 TRINITY_DN40740_c0_g1_i1:26-574(-)